jgi:hypothetical protein
VGNTLYFQTDYVTLKKQTDHVTLKKQTDHVTLKKQTDHVTLKKQTDLANLTMLLKFAAHLLKSKCNYLYYSIIFSYLRKIKYRTGILQN